MSGGGPVAALCGQSHRLRKHAGVCLLPTAGGDAALPADRLWAELPLPLRCGCWSSAGLDAETRCVCTAHTLSVHTVSAVLGELRRRRPADVLLLRRLLPRRLPGPTCQPLPAVPARLAVPSVSSVSELQVKGR